MIILDDLPSTLTANTDLPRSEHIILRSCTKILRFRSTESGICCMHHKHWTLLYMSPSYNKRVFGVHIWGRQFSWNIRVKLWLQSGCMGTGMLLEYVCEAMDVVWWNVFHHKAICMKMCRVGCEIPHRHHETPGSPQVPLIHIQQADGAVLELSLSLSLYLSLMNMQLSCNDENFKRWMRRMIRTVYHNSAYTIMMPFIRNMIHGERHTHTHTHTECVG